MPETSSTCPLAHSQFSRQFSAPFTHGIKLPGLYNRELAGKSPLNGQYERFGHLRTPVQPLCVMSRNVHNGSAHVKGAYVLFSLGVLGYLANIFMALGLDS